VRCPETSREERPNTASSVIANNQNSMSVIDCQGKNGMYMPPWRRGPVKVSQLLSHSLHAICKANQNPVDTRPPLASRNKNARKKGTVSESKKVRFAFQKDASQLLRH
jgi:hypothetical protein